AGASIVERFEAGMSFEPVDVAVVLDTAAWNQVEPMRPVLEKMSDRLMVVDHHLSGDMPAKWRWVDAEAGACAELVAQIVAALAGEDVGIEAAEGLYMGIASDTGWFRFSNTRPGTLELAAGLLRRGVDHARIYRLLEQTERPEKLALIARALASLRLVAGGRAAMMTLRAADFADTGARLEETERLIDLPQMVQSVEVVALITEPPEGNPSANGHGEKNGAIRLSFRSKPGPGAVNVSELAATFGGGGHARAAGAKVRESLDGVIEQVRAALERVC
ncbi:MAG: hypothetical protein IT442_10465, partial [Phycisphaeraceae bacterium]|nr:hypothetical protein [Phycisphaeraceae bacterium]